MGGSMAANLASKGYRVRGWNRKSDRLGVKIAATAGVNIVSIIEKALAEAEIIFTCVGNVPDVREVLLGNTGVINYARPKTLVVDMSTIDSQAAKEIERRSNHLSLELLQKLIAHQNSSAIGCVEGADNLQFNHSCKRSIEHLPSIVMCF